MTNSKIKGSVGERLAANYLNQIGFPGSRRTQQYAGNTGDASDVVSNSLPGVHIEVKFGYPKSSFDMGTRLLEKAIERCEKDCAGKPWVILWKPRGCKEWRATYLEGPVPVSVVGKEDIAYALERVKAQTNQLKP